jgi:hypothetical protein
MKNPLRWLEYLALELQGTRRCNTPKKLLAYMKGKDTNALHFWVETRMWYQRDGGKPWRQNWTPIEQVLARDVPGSDIETDCEERSIVRKHVINGLGWGHAENLVVWADNDTMAGGLTWCHAACLAWLPKELALLDYKLHRWPASTVTAIDAVRALGADHRVKPTRYCYCDDAGRVASEVFPV